MFFTSHLFHIPKTSLGTDKLSCSLVCVGVCMRVCVCAHTRACVCVRVCDISLNQLYRANSILSYHYFVSVLSVRLLLETVFTEKCLRVVCTV